MARRDPSPAACSTRPRSARHPDAGFSLVELIVAISLMGIATTSVLGGLWTATSASNITNDKSKVEAVLSSAADRLTGWAYLPCPGDDANGGYLPVVQAAAGSVGWPSSAVTILGIAYWSPTGDAAGSWVAQNGLGGTECNQAVGLSTSRHAAEDHPPRHGPGRPHRTRPGSGEERCLSRRTRCLGGAPTTVSVSSNC